MGWLDSDFYCTKCGERNFNVYRRKGQLREAGHLKKLWCWRCGEERNCVEIREGNSKYTKDMFTIEFNNGNFDEEGNRKNPNFNQFISEVLLHG